MQSVHACAVQTQILALFSIRFSRPQKNRKIQMVLESREVTPDRSGRRGEPGEGGVCIRTRDLQSVDFFDFFFEFNVFETLIV